MKYFLLIFCFLIIGCASNNNLYDWGNYDQSLFNHYKNPDKPDAFLESLELIIDKNAKKTGSFKKPLGPGIYAEYGYLLFERGRYAEAKECFIAEKKLYPESSKLMNRMISIILQEEERNSQ